MVSTATSFIYANESSQDYNVFLARIDTGALSYQFGLNTELQTEKIKGIDRTFLYGIENNPLTFELELYKETAWTLQDRIKISAWLFQNSYQDLIFGDLEYSDIVYNCIPFGNFEAIDYGGALWGVKIKMICSLPYPTTQTTVQQFSNVGYGEYTTIDIENLGNYNGYFYDIDLEIELLDTITDISLINTSDGGREFKFTGLSTGETISIQNQRGEIVSSTALNRYPKFNYNWLRLAKGVNSFTVTGKCNITVSARFPIII